MHVFGWPNYRLLLRWVVPYSLNMAASRDCIQERNWNAIIKLVFSRGTRRMRRMRKLSGGGGGNCQVQHSYFRLQKFAKHARRFVKCSRTSVLVRREFQKSLKFLANVSNIPRTIDDASEPPRMFGELLSLKYKCWILQFFRHSPSFANRSPFRRENTHWGLAHYTTRGRTTPRLQLGRMHDVTMRASSPVARLTRGSSLEDKFWPKMGLFDGSYDRRRFDVSNLHDWSDSRSRDCDHFLHGKKVKCACASRSGGTRVVRCLLARLLVRRRVVRPCV